MHPLGYFASAPDGTPDAAILSELVSHYGSYLERLNSEQKLALRAILSYYLFYKLKYMNYRCTKPGKKRKPSNYDTRRDSTINQHRASAFYQDISYPMKSWLPPTYAREGVSPSQDSPPSQSLPTAKKIDCG